MPVPKERTTQNKTDLWQHRDVLRTHLQHKPSALSAFSFVNVFLWQDFFEFDFEVIDNNLCIFARDKAGTFLYLPPMGPTFSRKAVDGAFNRMKEMNQGSNVTRIENLSEDHQEFFPDQEFSLYPKGSEYFYSREDIAQLKGSRYKSKRSSHNHFQKNYSFHFLPYEDGMREECEALYDHWAADRAEVNEGDMYQYMLEDGRLVQRLALRHHKELELVGRVVKVNGVVKGYTFGYRLDSETFCVLFEIADLAVKGLPVFMFSEFCRDRELAGYSLINVMDDFGMDNIKTTKMSFRPSRILPIYVATQKEG